MAAGDIAVGVGGYVIDGCAAAAAAEDADGLDVDMAAVASAGASHETCNDGGEIALQLMTEGVESWYVFDSDTANSSGATTSAGDAGDAIVRGGGEIEQNFPLHWR
jgi:hypothetical protein